MLLLQTARPWETSDTVRIILWCGILFALLIISYVAVTALRRRLSESDDAPAAGGFTLSDLRKLHAAGQMSDEEYERAKAQMIASMKAAMERQESEKKAKENLTP